MTADPFRRRRLALAVLACLTLLLAGCHRDPPLPELGEVPSFALTDQSGRAFTPEQLRGKVWAAAFVFTRCPMACPRVTREMKKVQEQAAARKTALSLVSFSVDPENDTPEVLTKYAKEYGVDLSTWTFVTGDASAIQTAAEKGFKIAVEGKADPQKADFGISHGTQLVLVDGKGKIRGYYASNEAPAMKQLLDDAGRLTAEL